MKKTLLSLFVTLALFGQVAAQSKTDPELEQLIQTVASLRQADNKVWDNALVTMENDHLWTPMDEAAKDANECYLIGNDNFRLNTIISRCKNHDKKMVRNEYLNGNDPNYNYSLTERGIKKMCSVSYELKHREGKQTFVVMPYDISTNAIEAQAYRNDNPVGEVHISNGNLVLQINENINSDDLLRLVITNHGNENMPVVIINHNTRKP